MRSYSLLIASAAAFALAAPPLAAAATFDVDRTADTFAGACTAAPNDCSLREAVQHANGAPGSTINIPAGTYTLTINTPGDDLNMSGDLDVFQSTTITGAGAATTIIQADGRADRVFDFHLGNPSAVSSIAGVTISGGGGVVQGAGIRQNDGTLSIADSTITDNVIPSASGGGGGVYFIQGALNLDRTTVSNNTVTGGEGGGIYTGAPAPLNIQNSTISGNSTAGSTDGGGGIYNQDSVTIVNSTVSGNATPDTGGGIDGGALIVVRNSTIAGNSAGNGGGVHADGSTTYRFENSIVSGNTGPPGTQNCGRFGGGLTMSLGHNLEDVDTCTFNAAGDLPNTNPLLEPLTNNGGSTQTLALPFGSPAIHAANAATCPATDQRGKPRAGGCDIGAFQYVDEIAPVLTLLKLSPRRFRSRRSGDSAVSSRKRAPLGARVGFTLSESASVIFTVERLTKGRRSGAKCRAKRKRGKRCTITSALPGSFSAAGGSGTNTFKFTGRLSGRKLKPGNYQLVATPTDTVGNAGAAVRARFKIVR
ncbi:MAG: right-handed parallel beta-helix repeat-containing protein [Actinobacteria bacterium]|nr:right-handed parallel beta-helix repeat-containing protein [Actinomycetota bacterium]